MKAMIFAAGRGERMRPLTEKTPKPLLKVGGKTLIEFHLEHLQQAGIKEVVINVAYLGQQIMDYLGDGKRWNLRIKYSVEPEPLETAGAIYHAKKILGDEPFLLINGDIWTDYSIGQLIQRSLGSALGHLVLVDNPDHHPEGDFSIDYEQRLVDKTEIPFTFSGISVMTLELINRYPNARTRFPLIEVLQFGIEHQYLTAEHYQGYWCDIGTVERLDQMDADLKAGKLS
jgi:MurNAc alpha-1-phosphate uridylyltransferase